MCGVRFLVQDNFIAKIENWPNFPNSPLCVKAYALRDLRHHPERLLYPIKRTQSKESRNPGWARISWDEAYEIIVSKLKEIRDKYGPESVVFYVGNPKEPRAAVQRLCYTFGSPNYATESSVCRKAAELAELLTYGFQTLGNPPRAQTRLCVIWGSNPAWSAPYMMVRMLKAKKRGVKFIVIDPRITPTSEKLANLHLRVRPASDGALALAMINVLFRDEIYDVNFAEKWIFGLKELKEYAEAFSPEKVEKITWVPAKIIEEAAYLIAENAPVTFWLSPQTTIHCRNGVQNHRAILSLIALTGCIDVPGGIIIPAHPPLYSWDSGDPEFCRRTDILPKIRDKRLDLQFFPVWARYLSEVQINMLPEYVRSGKVKAILMWGGNTMMWPQTREYQEAIKSLEFAVAVDYFYRPWTHDFVDIVLPAATCLERRAPFAFLRGRVYGRRVLKPPGECQEDWQIAFDIGVRLGYASEFWNGNIDEGLNFILKKIGLSLNDLEKSLESGVEIPSQEVYRKYEIGMLRADGKPGFPTPSGKIEVYSTVLRDYGFDPLPAFRMPLQPTKEYPLILTTGCRVPFYAHSRWREIPNLRRFMPHPVANISPRDAAERGIKSGDNVIVSSPWGSIKVKANVTSMMLEGVVDVLHGWAEANVNELIPREWDPISGFPPFKEGICEVKKPSEY